MMSTVQVPSAVVVLGAVVPALAACGSSGGVTFGDVQGCLQNAGYGVSVVPTAELVSNVTSHADAIGSVTVQAGGPLFATAIARNRAATPSGVVSAVKSSLTKIE